MPNEDNWQGDVLRAMRGGAGQGAQDPDGRSPEGQGYGAPAQGQDGRPYGAAAPGPGVPAQSPHAYGTPQHPGLPQPPQQYAGYQQEQQQAAQQQYPGYQEQQAQQPPPQQQHLGYQEQQQHQQPQQPQAGYQDQQPQAGYQDQQQQPPQQYPGYQEHPGVTAHSVAQPQQQQQHPQQDRPQTQAPYTPGTRPHHAPDSRPVVDRGLAALGRKARRGEPFTARAARALRVSVSSSAAREVARTTATAETLQQPVTTGRQIAVTSIRGGAGKSTVAALLGTTYAHYRQDPVLFVEADPSLGSLPLRLGAESLRWTTGDLAGIIEPQMSLLDITGYLVQLPGNAWLLPGSQGQIGAMLDSRAYERVMVSLRRYFGVTVVDCETLPAEVARVALSAAQARVLAAPATLEGITSTYAVLQWMQSLPRQVITGTVVVLSELVPHPGLDLDEATKKLEATGASVQVLPYDRHLAAGGEIRTELLAHATREAATRLAADVFRLSQQHH
ncbi:MinD/ParA family protein [Streptomyces sp. NBC_00893]|uniref:MinD/ParA family ATP-binding protein n=1 Tax=Streptomyces sp. NBC_00893 TaxID=2975862 RepID=UPI002251DC2C|nr:MinD/ParA family protein [Streptomyces sp. NBC_00893]MCX4845089.1 MinD/ParA family protein [Streptomyces sp. NBC_00893]